MLLDETPHGQFKRGGTGTRSPFDYRRPFKLCKTIKLAAAFPPPISVDPFLFFSWKELHILVGPP
jgi:hypothetical protein